MKPKVFGFRVEMTLGGKLKVKQTLRNVTEIHYNYPSVAGMGTMIAFESHVHAAGVTYPMSDVVEFEVFPETEKAKGF